MKRFYYFICVVVGFAFFIMAFFVDGSGISNYSSYTLEYGEMNFNIQFRGELRAAKFFDIDSKINSNMAKIIALIPEGAMVKKGDIVARFDTKPFTDEYSLWDDKISKTENEIISIKNDIKEFQTKKAEKIKSLEYSVDLANIELKDMKNGSGYLRLNELNAELQQKKRKVSILESELEDYNSLYEKGFISSKELKRIKDELKSAEENMNISENKLEIYINYEWPQKIKQAEIALEKSKEIMESQIKQIEIKINNLNEQLENLEDRLKVQKNKRESSESDILNCEIVSPIEGVVLYNELSIGGKKRKVQIGDSIWYGQSFMQIPDTSEMIVNAKIREFDLKYISKGQNVKIIPDAYSDKTFSGNVLYVSNVANSDSSDEPVKFFNIVIDVQEPEGLTLRSGMSVSIDVKYDTIQNALTVPINAVVYKNNKTFLRVKENNDYVLKDVFLGRANSDSFEVISGINKGDTIYY